MIHGKGGVTTGASNDIQRATEMAHNMVTHWGLSDRMGPQTYAEDEGEVFLGRSVTQHKNISDDTAQAIDEEVRRIIDETYNKATKLLEDNIDILHAMSDALMKYETIDSKQIDDLMNRTDVRKPDGWDENNDSSNTPTGSSGVKDESEAKGEEPKSGYGDPAQET